METLKTKTKWAYISRSLYLLYLKTRVFVPTEARPCIAAGLLLTGEIARFFMLYLTLLYFNFYGMSIHHFFDLAWEGDLIAQWISERLASALASWVAFMPLREASSGELGNSEGKRVRFSSPFLVSLPVPANCVITRRVLLPRSLIGKAYRTDSCGKDILILY